MIAEIVGQSAYPLLRIFVSSQKTPPPSGPPGGPPPCPPSPALGCLNRPCLWAETLAQLKRKTR
jgi:hypothetical protein